MSETDSDRKIAIELTISQWRLVCSAVAVAKRYAHPGHGPALNLVQTEIERRIVGLLFQTDPAS